MKGCIQMIQLAVDPATRFIGYSVMDTSITIGHDITKYGLLEIGRSKANQDITLGEKILMAYNFIVGLINQYRPDTLAIEDQFYSIKTPTVKNIIRISGNVILAAKQRNISVVLYEPRVIKMAVTRKGNADKAAVAEAVSKLYKDDGYVSLLTFSDKKTKNVDKTDDIFDSIAINLTHRFTRNGRQI